MTDFPTLFSEITLDRMRVKNRVFIPGHDTALSAKRPVSDERIAYPEARGEFGVRIRQFAYRTESSGAIMEGGCARVSGRIGVVTAQNGAAAALLDKVKPKLDRAPVPEKRRQES